MLFIRIYYNFCTFLAQFTCGSFYKLKAIFGNSKLFTFFKSIHVSTSHKVRFAMFDNSSKNQNTPKMTFFCLFSKSMLTAWFHLFIIEHMIL